MENENSNPSSTSTVEGGAGQQTSINQAAAMPSQPQTIEDRVNDIFATIDPNKGTQPQKDVQGENQDKGQAQPQSQPQGDATKPAQGQQAETDPAKIFQEASSRVFFTDKGDLDSAKVNDFFFSNGKSLLNFGPVTPLDIVEEQPKEKVNPEAEYHKKLSAFSENVVSEIEKLRDGGATAEDILQAIVDYHSGARSELKTAVDLKTAIDEQARAMASELAEVKQSKAQARIDRNNTELSLKFDGMVNGMTGLQVLNQFILDPKFGGPEIDRQFKAENPGFEKLAPEKKDAVRQKWFRDFQQDKARMAHVAEFGRLRWMMQQMKPILEHAQKVGAVRVANAGEAVRGGVGTIQNNMPSGPKSEFDKFFEGIDRVR
jgi:hypothetical protein